MRLYLRTAWTYSTYSAHVNVVLIRSTRYVTKVQGKAFLRSACKLETFLVYFVYAGMQLREAYVNREIGSRVAQTPPINNKQSCAVIQTGSNINTRIDVKDFLRKSAWKMYDSNNG